MAVGEHLLPGDLFTILRLPALAEADEKSLIASQSLQNGARLSVERQLLSVKCSRKACQIGNILTEGLVPIDGKIRNGMILIVLRGECFARVGSLR